MATTAKDFSKKMQDLSSPAEVEKYNRYFKTGKGQYGEGDVFIGVRMGLVFGLAKESLEMPLTEIEKLLDSPIHEVRAGALSIMNQLARKKKTSESMRKEMYELYLRRHDRINNWDLVDVSCIHVVGGYLYTFQKSREVLYK